MNVIICGTDELNTLFEEMGHEVITCSDSGIYTFFSLVDQAKKDRQPVLLVGKGDYGFWARVLGEQYQIPWIAIEPTIIYTEQLLNIWGVPGLVLTRDNPDGLRGFTSKAIVQSGKDDLKHIKTFVEVDIPFSSY